MVWHNCKTDPPKKSGEYIVVYFWKDKETDWAVGFWDDFENRFEAYDFEANYGEGEWADFKELYGIPYKWAEVDLSEVEQ